MEEGGIKLKGMVNGWVERWWEGGAGGRRGKDKGAGIKVGKMKEEGAVRSVEEVSWGEREGGGREKWERRKGGKTSEEGEEWRAPLKEWKCSFCSQETYGAAANSKSNAQSIEVCTVRRSEEYSAGLGGRLSQIWRDENTDNKISLVSPVDHLLYITLHINSLVSANTVLIVPCGILQLAHH